jgi:hypothetical protein
MLENECSDGIQYSNADDAVSMMQTHRPSRAKGFEFGTHIEDNDY